jgi:hypothetical protein
MERIKIIHLWIGTTEKNEEDYLKYFELDYSTEGDFDDPEYKLCEFCKDINKQWYNEDFIGIIPLHKNKILVGELIKETPIDRNEISKIIEECNRLNIVKGNAIFYLTDAEIEINKPYKENYNGLKYIGKYSSSLK